MNRRTFLQRLGILGAAVPFVGLKGKKCVVVGPSEAEFDCQMVTVDVGKGKAYMPVYSFKRYVRAKITTKGNGSALVELEYSDYPDRGFKKE